MFWLLISEIYPVKIRGQAVSVAYFQREVPQTKNRSLQDIELDLGLPGRHDDVRAVR